MAGIVITNGTSYTTVPEMYVRPVNDRPKLSEVCHSDDIPIIDFGCNDRRLLIKQVGEACEHYGFFQAINHGVASETVEKMQQISSEFFQLPVEERIKLHSDDPWKRTRFSTSVNVRQEKVHNWREYLRLHCYPLDQHTPEWPTNPSSFKEYVGNYCTEVRHLGMKILEVISESLGLEKERINKISGEQLQHMAINNYPKCPQPELTFGTPAHTDSNTLTILLQDPNVPGLQILKDGKWLAVKPYPNAFVINIGDQLEALSNGKYKGVWHRVIVNPDKPRMTIGTFLCPANDNIISAPQELLKDGSKAIYKNYTYAEYYEKFWNRSFDDGPCLELFKN